MPGRVSIVGVIGGLALIAGAIYLSARPYLQRDFMPGDKPFMPDPTGRMSDTGAPTGEDWLFSSHHDWHL